MKLKNFLFLFSPFLIASLCQQRIFALGKNNSERSSFCNKRDVTGNFFGKRYVRPHEGGGTVKFRKFHMNIYMKGTDFNYWRIKLQEMRQGRSSWTPNDFYQAFFEGGVLWPFLWWTNMRLEIARYLKTTAQLMFFPKDKFLKLTEDFFNPEDTPGGFNWFSEIFQIRYLNTLTFPVERAFTLIQKLREDGAILQIPYDFVNRDGQNQYNWFIGSGIKIFPQTPAIVNDSITLDYFYLSPYPSYSPALFERWAPIFSITTDNLEKNLIQENELSILKGLWLTMNINAPSTAEYIGKYLEITPESQSKKLSSDDEHPTEFTVNFLNSQSHSLPDKDIVTTLPFSCFIKAT